MSVLGASRGAWRGTAGALAALLALIVLFYALFGSRPGRHSVDLLTVGPGSPLSLRHVLAAAVGAGLLALARGLVRGRRTAVDVTAAMLAAITAMRLARHAPVSETVLVAAVAGLLLVSRRAFAAGEAALGARRAGVVAAGAVIAAFALGTIVLVATDAPASDGDLLAAAGAWMLDGHWWLRSGQPTAVILDVLIVVALASAAVMLRMLLRPAVPREGHDAAEHERASALVAAHGHDSLAPFALREDKAFHFSGGGMLAYRVVGATAVVSGDAIGPPGAAPAILASFERLADTAGWDVVMTAAGEEHLDAYRALGFRTVCVGEEAVVDPQRFSTEGRSIRKVRQSVTRVRRRGWTVAIVTGRELAPAVAARIEAVELEWRSRQPRLAGFAMTLGRLWGAREDDDALYVLAHDPQGTLQAFLRFVPYRDGLSLDIMRRAGGEPNGLSEALVVAAIEHARVAGVREVSLNFAGFAHLMASDAFLGPRQRLARWALHRAHGRFQLERLVAFNDKFFPTWRRRYLVHRGTLRLPVAGLRVLQAEAYVPRPRPRPRRDPRQLPAQWRPGAGPHAAQAPR